MRANADLLEMTVKGKADVFLRVFTRLHVWLRNYFDLESGEGQSVCGALLRRSGARASPAAPNALVQP